MCDERTKETWKNKQPTSAEATRTDDVADARGRRDGRFRCEDKEPSKKRIIDQDEGRVSVEKLGDLYDRHAFAVARDEPVEYQKLADNYGLKAELVEQILRHTRKPNIVEKYVDGQPRLVAERDDV